MAKKKDEWRDRRDVRMATVAIAFGFDSFELEDELKKAGLNPSTCTPEEAIDALQKRGRRAEDRRSWWPF